MAREKFMFRAHSSLMLDFSALLAKWRPVTFEESLIFVKKVKARDYMLYLSLFDILSRKELMPLEMYQELLLLFQNHDDLREEIKRFRPLAPPKVVSNQNTLWIFLFLLPLILLSLILVLEKPLACLIQQTFVNY